MPQRTLLALTAAAVLAVTGCSSGAGAQGIASTTARGTPAATTASAAPGCAQAAAAVLAARRSINARDYAGAVTRISDLRDTAHGKVAIDAALAATDLAFLSNDAASGNPVGKDLTDSLAALGKIGTDCGPGA